MCAPTSGSNDINLVCGGIGALEDTSMRLKEWASPLILATYSPFDKKVIRVGWQIDSQLSSQSLLRCPLVETICDMNLASYRVEDYNGRSEAKREAFRKKGRQRNWEEPT